MILVSKKSEKSKIKKKFFSEKALDALERLEEHLEDLDIQPMPEAQYVVYNRVPKVQNKKKLT